MKHLFVGINKNETYQCTLYEKCVKKKNFNEFNSYKKKITEIDSNEMIT